MRFLSLAVLTLFLLAGCAQPQEKPTAETPDSPAQEPAAAANSCIGTPLQVYHKTVLMWEQSWNNEFGGGCNAAPSSIQFSAANLQQLADQAANAVGVRMYYCLADSNDTIPLIAMVNIDGCNDIITSEAPCVLLSDGMGGHFVTPEQASAYTNNWNVRSNAMLPFVVKVLAYNFSWPLIQSLQQSPANPQNELFVSYGLRTIQPGDPLYDEMGLLHKGSIGYVNILHNNSDLRVANHEFDFAMPCPQYCDEASSILMPQIHH